MNKLYTYVIDGERVRQDGEHDATFLRVPDGLPSDWGAWKHGECRWAAIDTNIADVIQEFWSNGIGTYASCEGDPPGSEHREYVTEWSKAGDGPWYCWPRWSDEPAYCMVAEDRRADAEALLVARGCKVVGSGSVDERWGTVRWRVAS